MTWSYWLCETTTGRRLAPFEPTEGRWERKLNVVGRGQHSLIAATLGAGATPAARRASRQGLLRPWARTLVQCWDGVPMYGGIITGRRYQRASGQVQLDTLDLRALLARRTLFDWFGYGEGRVIKSTTALDMPGNARTIVRMGFQSSGVEGVFTYDVPIVFEPGNAVPNPDRREWWNYNIPTVENELADLQDEDGGPDIDFLPRWDSSGALEWLMRSKPMGGKVLEWNLSAEHNALTDVGVQDDALRQANVVHVTGDGQEADLKVKTARRAVNDGMPKLERVETYSQKGDNTVLQGLANSSLATYRDPTTQFSLAIQAGGKPGLRDLSLGQQVRTYARDDEWIEDGWSEHRLVGFSGGIDQTITLLVQPTGGA